jgi:hypothetical protein
VLQAGRSLNTDALPGFTCQNTQISKPDFSTVFALPNCNFYTFRSSGYGGHSIEGEGFSSLLISHPANPRAMRKHLSQSPNDSVTEICFLAGSKSAQRSMCESDQYSRQTYNSWVTLSPLHGRSTFLDNSHSFSLDHECCGVIRTRVEFPHGPAIPFRGIRPGAQQLSRLSRAQGDVELV